MKWDFYNPNKPWILYLAWKSLKTHTSDLDTDIIAKNEERSHTEPVFQNPKKVHENFSIQLKKNDHQKLIFEVKNLRERWKKLLQAGRPNG